MKSRPVHLAFAAGVAVLASIVVGQALDWRRGVRVNDAIARAAAPAPADRAVPEARFAQAAALAASGPYETARAATKALVQDTDGPLRTAAQYNLGNLYLREALAKGPDAAAESMPLIELAKQAYREALRADPDDWDARYNLERALRLVPESDEVLTGEAERPSNRDRVTARTVVGRSDLP